MQHNSTFAMIDNMMDMKTSMRKETAICNSTKEIDFDCNYSMLSWFSLSLDNDNCSVISPFLFG